MKPRLIALVIVALAAFGLLAGYATDRQPSPAYATNTASADAGPAAARSPIPGEAADPPINVAN
jgi:hypothetical protein